MNSRLVGGIVALVLAVVGAILLLNYVRGADQRAQAGLEPQVVLVATADIEAGTAVAELSDFLETATLPTNAVADGALSDLEGRDGLVLGQPVLAGEQLLEAKLVDPAEQLEPGTVPVPEGLQEVTVALDPARVVGGKIRAGDRVGIFGNYEVRVVGGEEAGANEKYTRLLMEQVLVTGIQIASPEQTDTAAPDGVSALPTGSAFVTFAVDTDQAGRIIFTQDFGLTWLTKQNDDTRPGDSGAEILDIEEILR
ncbi:Flp pilus assembly protein CpaB [Zhihengliuella halotolerans]|uniref:Pilus assembly protein CpaB n=1 Tax=Zhihengliuella halotolerans TaxID=370736 RepID=A0A4Q8A9P9_9MICC|nr:RcpC/CpaB family pilus assembly protein [Zhihengliuella halotolerans]RZU60802.1 pilus assembly protein CpaB [Zhihengliuella halotolerans]